VNIESVHKPYVQATVDSSCFSSGFHDIIVSNPFRFPVFPLLNLRRDFIENGKINSTFPSSEASQGSSHKT
jgi:hypothetical protein